MPLNQIKKYPELLELCQFNEYQRIVSLKGIFKRDIEDNPDFKFRTKPIRPIKKEGQIPMETLFNHLIKKEEKDVQGKKTGARIFEMARSQRLHWIKFHIEERKTKNIDVFSYEDRIEGRGNVIRTYIYDFDQEYVIILEPQRSKLDYYLITAYHFNEPGGKKQILKKQKNKLNEIY
jgi:hypothetical protein